jgi:FkbM family methyltransferase
VARSAFHLSRLEPVPGWRFGQWDRKDPRAWARAAIWKLSRSAGYDGPVTTGWYFGLRFNHHLSGDMSICTYVDGRYEPNEMYAMSELLAPGMCVVDVGANAGVFTLMAAKLVGAAGAVHAFEPSPRDRQRMLANIALNGLSNVSVHPEALGAKAGKAVLAVAGAEHPGHNTIGGFAYAGTVRADSVEVDVTSLDEFAEAAGLTRLDLLKIDVEGSETAVLRGAAASLRRFRPIILAEAAEDSLRQLGSSVSELVRLLRASGYDLNVFGPSGTPEPLNDDRPAGLNLLCLPREPKPNA